MSSVKIECPECACEIEVEESAFGQTLKCPKCKESFTAEKPGLYDFVEDSRPASSSPAPVPRPASSPASRTSRASRGKPARDEEPEALSDEMKSELLSSMEKWAEE